MNTVVQTKSKLPGFLSLLLVAVLGVAVAKLMWLIITPKTKMAAYVQENTSAVNKPKQKINYGKLIANQHLFGIVELKKAAPVAKVAKPNEAPKVAPTKLNLKLHGIVAYRASKGGFALISSGSGSQKVYGKGDELEKGVTVSEIFSDKVVLNNHGKSEDLLLPINKASRSSVRGGNSNHMPNQPNNESPPPDMDEDIPQPGVNMSESSAPNPDSPDLSSFREEMRADPSKLMRVARGSPAIVDGQFVGFRIQPGSRRKLFRKLGFRPNDIITEVNGIVIDDMSKGAMVIGELSQASSLSVKVKRGNQEISIDHSF
ncbi:MAG: type II secretion system protein GspC [Cocleimonas sp.]|nr:type II secretion system protein GspC [Cocleimonas sp.]